MAPAVDVHIGLIQDSPGLAQSMRSDMLSVLQDQTSICPYWERREYIVILSWLPNKQATEIPIGICRQSVSL